MISTPNQPNKRLDDGAETTTLADTPEEKLCRECGVRISGRVDKKFCSDQCRVTHNNKLNSDETNYIRNVNNILRRNRRILRDLRSSGEETVARERMSERGFDFNHYTSTVVTQDGKLCHYCYELGYLATDNVCLLVVKQEYV